MIPTNFEEAADAPSVLLVVSHPDDEVLGCGSTAALMAREGIPVRACILSGDVEARTFRPDDEELLSDVRAAHKLLNLGEPILGSFPNIQLNVVPHIQLVQFIEDAIEKTKANILFTHHPGDLNNDHRQTSLAAMAAARLSQRRPEIGALRAIYFMEILSSTDWAFPADGLPFRPDTFVPAGEALNCKIAALRAYRNVMREFPHPRSEEVLRGLAAYRGGQAGLDYAEAFQTAFRACRRPALI